MLGEEEIAEIESLLDKLLTLPKVILDIAPGKTAAELVAEGRDR